MLATLSGCADWAAAIGGIVKPSTITRLTALTGTAANWYRASHGPRAPPRPSRISTQSCDAIRRFSQFWINSLADVIRRVNSASSVGGKALCPVCSHALTSASVVSPFATQAGYFFTPTQLVIRGYAVPRKAGCVTLRYTAGYLVIPPDLAQACIELVALRYRERSRIGEVARAIGGGETVSYSQKDMSDSIKTLIQQYRVVAPIVGFLLPAPSQTDAATLAGAV